MNTDIPALDCREVVHDLAKRLGSLSLFLDGINDLMKFNHLEDRELQRYGRKIIALTEGARMTLKREGVALYLFVLCPEDLLPYKSAYFKLLICIRRRRPAFPADIGDRIASLLFALESNFVIRFGGVDTRAQLGIEELLVPKNPLAACGSTTQIAAHVSSPREAASDVMLPPDTWANKRQRIHLLKNYSRPEAANRCHPRAPSPQRHPPSDNLASPRPRRAFVRTNAHRFDGSERRSSLQELLNLRSVNRN